ICIGASTTGFFVTKDTWYERILFFLAGVALIKPGIYTDILGAITLAAIWLLQSKRLKQKTNQISA
ncbi:MAG: DUF3394 domain-containing protein, partial [Enterococcus sp.]|nr:DUF3394 domain-containing protein [Enterococcus sp.]